MSELLQFIIVIAFGGLCFGCGYLTAFIVTRNKWREVARYNWQTGKWEWGSRQAGPTSPITSNGTGSGRRWLPAVTRSILIREAPMPICETCGNDYDKAFQVTLNGSTHTFDSFECAIQALAPTCPHCGTHVVGHGVEKDGTIFCCAHCAKQEGVTQLRDRA